MTVKSISIKDVGCKSSERAVKAVELTPGGLHRVPESGLGRSRGLPIAVQKSAEGIVPGESGKARTERSGE